MKLLLKITTFIFFFLSLSINAMPKTHAVPGGVVVINLGEMSEQKPAVFFQKKPVMVVKKAQQWHAVVGLPLSIKPGNYCLQLTDASRCFDVQAADYPAQYLTIKNKRHVNPAPLDLKRIGKESQTMRQAFNHWQEENAPVLSFAWPVEGPISSAFGLKRFYNEQPRKPHSGLDIAAPEGTNIIAPAPGKVVAVGHYFFNGNTVMLDHGHGLVTLYCHMQRIDVAVGQSLRQGAVLGTVGKTGRVTGAHLHWGVSLNDARVDPQLWLAQQQIPEK